MKTATIIITWDGEVHKMEETEMKEFIAEQRKKRVMFIQNLAFNKLKEMSLQASMFERNESVYELIRTMQ